MALPVRAAPISSGRPVTTLITPAGMPTRSASTASANAESGVASAGFTTVVQPAASAGPSFRVIIASGKFQGVITPTTPTGSLLTRMRVPGFTSGTIVP